MNGVPKICNKNSRCYEEGHKIWNSQPIFSICSIPPPSRDSHCVRPQLQSVFLFCLAFSRKRIWSFLETTMHARYFKKKKNRFGSFDCTLKGAACEVSGRNPQNCVGKSLQIQRDPLGWSSSYYAGLPLYLSIDLRRNSGLLAVLHDGICGVPLYLAFRYYSPWALAHW